MNRELITWKEGEGWSKEDLVWSEKDTAIMEKALAEDNKTFPTSYESIIKEYPVAGSV